MNFYRISKYNPKYRNQNGVYQGKEWTSFSDIGKEVNGYIVDKEEYLRFENLYIRAVKDIAEINEIEKFLVKSLEYYPEEITEAIDDELIVFLKELKTKESFDLDELRIAVKILLRDLAWFMADGDSMKFSVGYDLYLYVASKEIFNEVNLVEGHDEIFIEKIEKFPWEIS